MHESLAVVRVGVPDERYTRAQMITIVAAGGLQLEFTDSGREGVKISSHDQSAGRRSTSIGGAIARLPPFLKFLGDTVMKFSSTPRS